MTSVVSPGDMAQLAFGKLPHAALLTRGREHVVTLATRLFGSFFGEGDYVGLPLHAAYPSIALAPCADAMDRALGDGSRVLLEHIAVGNENGNARYSFTAEPLAASDGRVMGVLLVAERHIRTDGELPNTTLHRQILESTLAAMREGVCVTNADGTIVFAKRAADRMYASDAGALIGSRFEELSALPQWELARVKKSIDAEVRQSGSWSGDRLHRRVNGERFVVSSQVTAFSLGGEEFRLSVEEDVTEQRRSDERSAFIANAASILGQSLDYRATLGTVAQLCVSALSDVAVIDVTDDAGVVERVGAAARPESQLADVRALPALMRRTASGNSPSSAGATGLTTAPVFVRSVVDGSTAAFGSPESAERWQALGVRSWMAIPISLHGDWFGTIALGRTQEGMQFTDGDLEVVIDLSARVANAIENTRLHAVTMAARDEAERANLAKSQLLAHASHDLRTPLNAISGYAELLEMGILGSVNDAQRDALARIQRSQRHLLALINDLLHFTKLESGSVEFDFAEIDLSNIAREVTSLLREQAANKGIELRYDSAASVVAWGDEEKVFQVVLNLVRNAVKFTSSAGEVVVRVAEDASGELARVTVTDNGIGIPPDKVEAIFEPFTQLGRSFSRPLEGSGLGLAISRELTRAMGGSLRVASALGKGSTFSLELPRRRAMRRGDA